MEKKYVVKWEASEINLPNWWVKNDPPPPQSLGGVEKK